VYVRARVFPNFLVYVRACVLANARVSVRLVFRAPSCGCLDARFLLCTDCSFSVLICFVLQVS
jgi:hypothetical protein